MKLLLATTAAATLAATAALASGPVAPAPYVPPVTVPMPSAHDWTGAYVGFGVTYGRFRMDEAGALPDFPDTDGFGASLLAGYNWQSGNLVYGGEVALDFSRRDGENSCGAVGGTCISESNHQASIRGRLGYAMDRSMVFMTAGYATDSRKIDEVGVQGDGARFTGPMLGIGFEHAMNASWNLRGDLEHYFYGDEVIGGNTTSGEGSLVRLSLVRRF